MTGFPELQIVISHKGNFKNSFTFLGILFQFSVCSLYVQFTFSALVTRNSKMLRRKRLNSDDLSNILNNSDCEEYFNNFDSENDSSSCDGSDSSSDENEDGSSNSRELEIGIANNSKSESLVTLAEDANSNKSCSIGLSIGNNGNTSSGNKNSRNDTEGIWNWDVVCPPNEKPLKIDFTGAFGTNPNIMNGFGEKVYCKDVVNQYLDCTFWEELKTQVNNYANEKISFDEFGTPSCSMDSKWFETTADEMKAFISLCLLQSQVKKDTLQSYWSTRKSIETPFFASVMPYKRFLLLCRHLHLVDNSKIDSNDKLAKVRFPLDFLNNKFQEMYTPDSDIAIDESLVKCRGRMSFIQFNPTKRARFGVKYYKLCESKSGYCTQFRIYSGKKLGADELPSNEAIVMELMEPYLKKGYTLYIDNWYSSPNLFRRLSEQGTNVIGTVRVNRKNMPREIKETKLKKGEVMALFSHKLMALKWHDKKEVTMLSTVHDKAGMTNTGKKRRTTNDPLVKPKAVIDYNKGMGGVDRMDQQLASFPLMRRYVKAYKKIFFYLLDMTLYNSYVLYKKITRQFLKYNEFRVLVAEQWLEDITLPSYAKRGRPSADSEIRLQAAYWGHFPRYIRPNQGKANPSRGCVVCAAKRSDKTKRASTSRMECEKVLWLYMYQNASKYTTPKQISEYFRII